MPTTRFFPSQSFASLTLALPQMVRFLVNDHSSITGPGWTIVEAYDGTTREVPSDSSDMDSFTGGFGWRTDTLGADDWIVLESADANNTNHFQLYLELQSTTTINFMMIPFEDFATGGSAVSPPLFPTSSYGVSSGSFVVMAGFSTEATYSIVADEGMAAILNDNNTTSVDYMYVGELDTLMVSGTQGDLRSYVIRDDVSSVGHTNSAVSRWTRLSPLDNKTVIEDGWAASRHALGANTRVHEAGAARDNLLGLDSILPVSVWFNDTGHRHFAGYMRNVFGVYASLPEQSGTMSGSNFMHRANQAAEGQICMRWDGSTAYGRDTSGSLIQHPQIASGNFDFFTVEPDTGNVTTYMIVTSSQPAAAEAVVGGPSGSFDRHRTRITYPFKRLKPRRFDFSEG